MNAHPVIRINMKNITHPTYQVMVKDTIEQISQIYRSYHEVIENDLFEYEIDRYNDIANARLTDPMEYVSAIAFLTELIYKKYHLKTIILIDEYDTPLENAQQYGFYDEATKRSFSTS